MLQSLLHFLHLLFDSEGLKQLVQAGGPQLICGIVFIETGFFVGFFLPGDSLLFAMGALAATDGSPLRLELLIVLLISAAVLGDAVNYFIGFWVGPRVFTVWQAWRADGDRVRVSMDGFWHDPGDIVGGMAAVGIVESWVLQADDRVLYITNDALWLFPLWFMERINDLLDRRWLTNNGPCVQE